MNHPEYFLDVVFHEATSFGDDLALCAGFERGNWRHDQFAEHVMEWLPEFALNHSELSEIGHQNAVRITKKAAKIVYDTEKYGLRGEFGELFLHIAIRQIYKTIPAVSKIYYKTAINETVKGFDAVHVVKKNNELELWIGETKFYKNITKAIYDVTNEIIDHLETDYLKAEFILIKNKIDPTWSEAALLKKLLGNNATLDEVFTRVCIPILLTYESTVVQSSNITTQIYKDNLQKEMSAEYIKLRKNLNEKYKVRFNETLPITIHIILIPLKEKQILIDALDTRLKAMQT